MGVGLFKKIRVTCNRFRSSRYITPISAIITILPWLFLARPGFAVPVAGDVAPYGNRDGVLNAGDAVVMQRFAFGLLIPTADELIAGDVAPLGSPDGVINAADVAVHMRAVLGLITLPPIPDEEAPAPADIAFVTVGPSISGIVAVDGASGSVEADATVSLSNLETGEQTVVTAGPDGSFTTNIAALDGQVLSILVTDAAGNTSESVSVSVGDLLSINISSPIIGEIVNDDAVLVTGTFSGPPGTSIVVNGQIACIDGNAFYAENVKLLPGSNTLTATASIADGIAVTDAATVTSTGAAAIQVSAAPTCGFAPHNTDFRVNVSDGTIIQLIEVDFDGDGLYDSSTTDPSAATNNVYAVPGVYQSVIRVTDDQSNQLIFTQQVIVKDVTGTDALLRSIYTGMLDRLRAGSIEGALRAVAPGVIDKYRDIFTTLQADLPVIVDQLGTLQGSAIGQNMAEYVVVRQVGTEYKAFMVYFSRGADGVWRIEGM